MSESPDLATRVFEVLTTAAGELARKSAADPVWTLRIKQALVAAAEEEPVKLYRCASDCADADWGEWQFDLCWLARAGEGRGADPLRRIVLAVESEWGDWGDVEDDFEKLMAARADLRLMIFQEASEVRCEALARRLADLVRAFEQGHPSDRYLLAAYDNSADTFLRFDLSGDGALRRA